MAETYDRRKLIYINDVPLPPPSRYDWGLMDISAAESGRNSSGRMVKARVTQKRKVTVEWLMRTPEEVSQVLKAVNPEYIDVVCWDAMENKMMPFQMYVGDRTAPVKFWWDGHEYIEKLGFELIEV